MRNLILLMVGQPYIDSLLHIVKYIFEPLHQRFEFIYQVKYSVLFYVFVSVQSSF